MFALTVEDVQARHEIPEIPEKPKNEGKGFSLKRPRRSVSLMKNIEVLLVADYKMVEYYGNRDLENYLLTIMNMVRVALTTYVCRLRSCRDTFLYIISNTRVSLRKFEGLNFRIFPNFLSSFKLQPLHNFALLLSLSKDVFLFL